MPTTFREVARAMGEHDEARRLVMAELKRRGGSPDAWHDRATRVAMAEAMTAAEDAIEHVRGDKAERARVALRTIRRKLECELWP